MIMLRVPGRFVLAFAIEVAFPFRILERVGLSGLGDVRRAVFPRFASGPCMASPSAFGRSRALTSTDVLHALAAAWHDKWQGGRCGFAHAT